MKYLIVNGDDFGASNGINRGIMEAHQHGILTSTSLLVNAVRSQEAAQLSRRAPEMSVGLHADLRNELKDAAGPGRVHEALREQLRRFTDLMGRLPTHLDSHHNLHRDPQALPCFLELAAEHGLPLREHSLVRYFSKFYGQWSGKTHLEQISVENLARMLEAEIKEDITEMSCHPGYIDPDYRGSYSVEREVELRTLCDPRIRHTLEAQAIRLVSYHDLPGGRGGRGV